MTPGRRKRPEMRVEVRDRIDMFADSVMRWMLWKILSGVPARARAVPLKGRRPADPPTIPCRRYRRFYNSAFRPSRSPAGSHPAVILRRSSAMLIE